MKDTKMFLLEQVQGAVTSADSRELYLKYYTEMMPESVKCELPNVTVDEAAVLLGNVRFYGKKLSDFQKKQTAINMFMGRGLDALGEATTALSKRVAKLEEQNRIPNQGAVLSIQCGRLLEALGRLRGLEDVREQLQYSTPVLKELDKMFAACGEKTERFHRQLILKLRSAVKLNCDKELFTEDQIHLLEELAEELRNPELEKAHVLTALDRLMDADLSPLPSLEDEDGEKENKTVSGYDDPN